MAGTEDSWMSRLTELVGTHPTTGASLYETGMRRSLQTIILYEAKRIVDPLRSALKPYQRKAAFLDQAAALVDSCVFITNKEEILWRTGTSKEPLNEEIAWKRVRLIEKELEKLSKTMEHFCLDNPTGTHEEWCQNMVQSLYEANHANRGRPVPRRWEHANNHLIMAYRLYFRGTELDPTFPKPNPPRPVQAPNTRKASPLPPPPPGPTRAQLPAAMVATVAAPAARPPAVKATTTMTTAHRSTTSSSSSHHQQQHHHTTHPTITTTTSTNPVVLAAQAALGHHTVPQQQQQQQALSQQDQARLSLLKEIRENLELLKEFEGVIADADIRNRKRQLFFALPPVPKRTKSEDNGGDDDENNNDDPGRSNTATTTTAGI